MPYKKGDIPSVWTLADIEIAYQEGDITEAEFQQWKDANSCPCIEAGRACDGSCM